MKYNTYHFFFRNLANPIKTEIISALKEKESSVKELVKRLKIEQSKLSHSLASLRFCNLVLVKKRGKERIYSLNKKTILPILKIIDKHEKEFCKECKYHKK